MFSNKIIYNITLYTIAIIGIVNLYVLATQTVWVVVCYAVELLIIRYLNKNLPRKLTPQENVLLAFLFWIIPVVIYFLIPSTSKEIYKVLIEVYLN